MLTANHESERLDHYAERNMTSKTRTVILWSFVVVGGAGLWGCVTPHETEGTPKVEARIPDAPTATSTSAHDAPEGFVAPPGPASAEKPVQPNATAPRLNEVQDAISRVFKTAVTIDAEQKPAFITGDFNADGSPDIAVIVKPTESMLSEINSEVANWT